MFGYVETPNFPPRYNVAPTQPVPIVRAEKDGKRHFRLVRWGLVPDWAKEVGAKPLFNARSETITDKPAFRAAFRRRRCLVPADGFYEWQPARDADKQPYLIRRCDRQPMALAGIWEHWQAPDGSELESCSIVTTAANATLSRLHHRMPVIIDQSNWEVWLDTSGRLTRDAIGLLVPPSDDLLDVTPVSKRVNSVANDDQALLEPVSLSPDAPKKSGRGEQMNLF